MVLKVKMMMLKFIKNYDEDSDKGYITEVDVDYPKKIHKCNKLVRNLCDKNNYVVHFRS